MLLKRFALLNVGHVQTSILQWAAVRLTIFCARVSMIASDHESETNDYYYQHEFRYF